MHWLLLWFVACGLAGPLAAQPAVPFAPGSGLWIEGRSNVSAFACHTDRLHAHAERHADRTTARLRVPTASLDCGHPVMNADLQAALRAEHHPTITFDLIEAHLANDEPANDLLRVRGLIRLAGQGRIVTFTARAVPTPDGYRLTGRVPLDMRAFGVTPPTAMLGLVRAQPEIVVVFDLRARLP